MRSAGCVFDTPISVISPTWRPDFRAAANTRSCTSIKFSCKKRFAITRRQNPSTRDVAALHRSGYTRCNRSLPRCILIPWDRIEVALLSRTNTRTLGKLIAIEGIDGSGKRTQLDLLTAALNDAGVSVYSTGFPQY